MWKKTIIASLSQELEYKLISFFYSVYKQTPEQLSLFTGGHNIRITKENFPDTGINLIGTYSSSGQLKSSPRFI